MVSDRLGCAEDALRRYGIDIFSAGIAAGNNHRASLEAVDVLRSRGIDISQHLSRRITAEMLAESDHVYAMTRSQLTVLKEAKPDLTGRMELVTRNGRDIADPFGGVPADYQECADQITVAIRLITDDLIRKDEAAT